MSDVYTYDDMPEPLRVQILHIIGDAIGRPYFNGEHPAGEAYALIVKTLRSEYGTFQLAPQPLNMKSELFEFFLREKDVDRCLDVVELSMRVIERFVAEQYQYWGNVEDVTLTPADAVADLNTRLRESGVGYQYVSGDVVRVDSQVIHAEAVLPVLSLLRLAGFEGADAEFLEGHLQYRKGHFKQAIVSACKAFESTMKAICAEQNWTVDADASSRKLVNTVLSHGLLPQYMETQLGAVRTLLESGVATVRNKNGGHGDGSVPVDVPDWYARYALNLTATTMLFLLEAHQHLERG